MEPGIRREPARIAKKRRGSKAWLVLQISVGKQSADDVLAIYSGRYGAERIRQLVESMYAASHLSFFEQWCRARNPSKYNPYPAAFDRVDGVPYQGLIFCGGNPLLIAKYVENLRVVEDGDGNEIVYYVYRGEPRAL